jgi:hypothetical protein
MDLKTVLLDIIAFLVIVERSDCVKLFLNEWSLKIVGGKEAADHFALENGFVNLGEIIPGSNLYHMKYPRRSKRSLSQGPML